MSVKTSSAPYLTQKQIWKQPLPLADEQFGNRLLFRVMASLARSQILDVKGDLGLLQPENDPFIIAINHNQRLEAVMVPSMLFFLRRGRVVHFMADWQFMIMPVVATLYRRSQAIIVTNKHIKPRFLNRLKPLFQHPDSAFERARQRLEAGSSLGIFPEGTVNRNPERLMRGLPGAAKLSLQTGAPVLPLGIRFPRHQSSEPIPDGARMTLHIGRPIKPPARTTNPKSHLIQGYHAEIMTSLAEISGKSWESSANKRRRYVV